MKVTAFIKKNPVSSYVIFTFSVSWLGAFLLIAPKLFKGIPISKMDGILMFPIMLIGPFAAGILFTWFTQGINGLRNLKSGMLKWKVSFKWYLMALLIPSGLILFTLILLENTVSISFKPDFYLFGFLFGIPAGFFEEIGWTGFALPQLLLKHDFIKSSVGLGLIWGLWHLPVIDFLGAASPHKQYLFLFAMSFIVAMMAMRVIISWIYLHTKSVLMAQFTHIISTGSLVVFGPLSLTPGMETLWYFVYALLLWVVVIFIFISKLRKGNNVHPDPNIQFSKQTNNLNSSF